MPVASGDTPPTLAATGYAEIQPFERRDFGDYELLEEIARGGMGIVYKARDRKVNRIVALKMVLSGNLGLNAVKRFKIEAEAAAGLDHPNIVPIYEVGEIEGRSFFTMKFVEGGSLSSRISTFRKDVRSGARLMAIVARAVHHAHQRGVLHRDLKPANILLNEVGEPFVTDFGLARRFDEESDLTHSGAVIGTPNFMAPEQAAGKMRALTTAADIFSLGAILYNVLTGRAPFRGDSLLELLQCVQDTEPQRLTALNRRVDRDLETICVKCLEKDPRNRYRSALELAEDLERWLANETIIARRSTPGERVVKWIRRKPVIAALTGLCALAVVFGIVGIFYQWRQAEAARVEAEKNAGAERMARNDAQKAFQQTAALLTDIELEKSGRLLHEGNSAGGLAYLARVLRRDPANEIAAERLMATLTQRSFAVPQVGKTPTTGFLVCAAFSPDRKRVIIGANAPIGLVCDAVTGQALTPPIRHQNAILCAVFSSDGRYVATGSQDYTARVWDSQTGEPVTPPLVHEDSIHFLAFGPEGDFLLTSSKDHQVRCWNIPTGELRGKATHAPSLNPPGLIVSRDGKKFLTGGPRGVARIFDPIHVEEISPQLLHSNAVSTGAFSPDGTKVAIRSESAVYLWDISTKEPRAIILQLKSQVSPVAFSRDGRYLATGDQGHTVQLWDSATGQPVLPEMRHADGISHLDFSRDGKRLLSASRDQIVQMWSVETGQPIAEPIKHDGQILAMGFGADDQTIQVVTANHTIRNWTLLQAAPAVRVLDHSQRVNSFTYSSDGSRVVSSGGDGKARIWELATGKIIASFDHGAAVVSARLSPDGSLLATAGENRMVTVWSVATGGATLSALSHPAAIREVRFNAEGTRVLVSLVEGVFAVWDAATGRVINAPLVFSDPRRTRMNSARYGESSFSEDGRFLLHGSSGRYCTVVDLVANTQLTRNPRHPGILNICQFSGDANRLITASHDNSARVWTLPSGRPLSEPLRHDGIVLLGALNHKGTKAVTASEDQTARLWDVATSAPLTDPLKHEAPVRFAEFSPDETRVVTMAADFTVNLWDVKTGMSLRDPLTHGERVSAVNFSPDGKSIATSSLDGKVRIWSVTTVPSPVPGWVLEFAEVLGGERIDQAGHAHRVPLEELIQLRDSVMARAGDDFYTREIKRLFSQPMVTAEK